MTATTVGGLIQETRRLLMGANRGEINKLSGAITDTATTATLLYDLGAGIGPRSYLTIDDEIIYVYQKDDGQKSVTIERAQLGTVAAAHADGALVEVNARFPKPVVRDALVAEIRSWPKGVYAIGSATLAVGLDSYSADIAGLPSTYFNVLEVLRKPTTLDTFSSVWRPVAYRDERAFDVGDFASGSGLFLNEVGPYSVRIVYSRPFDLTDFADDATLLIDDVLLEEPMLDIPPYGVAWRLLSGNEVVRTALEPQGTSRDPAEVAVGATLRAAAGFQALRDGRLVQEAERLQNRFPWRRSA